jgi:hypothetical protein
MEQPRAQDSCPLRLRVLFEMRRNASELVKFRNKPLHDRIVPAEAEPNRFPCRWFL